MWLYNLKYPVRSITDELKEYCQEFFDRMYLCEGQKWDLEYEVRKREWEVLQFEKKTKKKIKLQNFISLIILFTCFLSCVLYFFYFLFLFFLINEQLIEHYFDIAQFNSNKVKCIFLTQTKHT